MDALTIYLLGNIPTNGWSAESSTRTYVDAANFSTPGDISSRYTGGTKLSCTEAASTKYFYVKLASYAIGTGPSGTTTVTITGGSDYTLSGGAITNPMYSYMATPYGFPTTFSVTLAQTGWTGTPSQNTNFTINGRMFTIWTLLFGTSTTGATTVTLPVTVAPAFPGYGDFFARIQDNGGALTTGLAECTQGSATVTFTKDLNVGAFTTSGTKIVR